MTPPAILTLGSAASPLGFTRTGGGQWEEWDRFLTLDGKPAYHIGNICNTCEFFFRRLDGANRSVSAERVGAALAAGPPPPDPAWISAVGEVLPPGEYIPFYTRSQLTLVPPGAPSDYYRREQVATWGLDSFWGLPHDPRTEYYRGRVQPLTPAKFGNRAIFEFVVPMFPRSWLKKDRVAEYYTRSEAEPPTVLALSVLDIKGPATWDKQPEVAEHWCLAHYILDGHHKAYAAATAGAPLGILSYLAVRQSIATPEQALDVAARLSEPPAP